MDRLEAMSLLLDVVESGSFSAAARHRGMSVATLTRRIDHLEQKLGAALLLRSTRHLILTDAGRRYIDGARAILIRVSEIEREAAGEFVEPTGRLVVSAPRMFGRLHVLPIVEDFLRQHPGIIVDLQLADTNVDLAGGAADVAVRIGPLPDSSLVATRIGMMRSVTAVSPALLQRFPIPEQPDDLNVMPSIALDIPLPPRAMQFAGVANLPGGDVRLSVTSAEAAVDAAIAGIGVVRLLHYQVAEAISAGRLQLVLERYEPAPSPVHLLHAQVPLLAQKIRRFLTVATVELRKAMER